jgi:hypothetical protein
MTFYVGKCYGVLHHKTFFDKRFLLLLMRNQYSQYILSEDKLPPATPTGKFTTQGSSGLNFMFGHSTLRS